MFSFVFPFGKLKLIFICVAIAEPDLHKVILMRGANKIKEFASKCSVDTQKLLIGELDTCVKELFPDSLDQIKEKAGEEAKKTCGALNMPHLKWKKIQGI